MFVPCRLLVMSAGIVAGMGRPPAPAGKPAAPSCPEDIELAYGKKWLVIVASSSDEEAAKKVAAKDGYCVIGKDLFYGLSADKFAVVAAAKDTRKEARAELARLRKRHKDAYVKDSGESCGNHGPPLSAEDRAFMARAEEARRKRLFTPVLETRAPYWQFLADVEGDVPIEASALFQQADVVRQEYFFFDNGALVGASVDEYWDGDEGHLAPPKSYYFRNRNDCFLQIPRENKDDGGIDLLLNPNPAAGFACPQSCAPGLRAKIASRAQQILAAANAKGAALEKIVAGIDEGWVDHPSSTP